VEHANWIALVIAHQKVKDSRNESLKRQEQQKDLDAVRVSIDDIPEEEMRHRRGQPERPRIRSRSSTLSWISQTTMEEPWRSGKEESEANIARTSK
jgi:hypothetical protein